MRKRWSFRIIFTVAASLGLWYLLYASVVRFPAAVADDDYWSTATPLPVELSGSEAVVIARGTTDAIYVLGGDTNDGASSRVYSTTVGANGALEGWRSSGYMDLPTPLDRHAVVTAQAYHDNPELAETAVYVIGGYDGNTRYPNIWRGDIDKSTGNIGWQDIGNFRLPIVRHSAAVAQIGPEADPSAQDSYLYILGGLDPLNRPLQTVWYAKVSVEPEDYYTTPIEFNSTALLPKPLYNFETIVSKTIDNNSYIYIIGGHDGENAQSSVYYAAIGDKGALTPWVALPSLPRASYGHKAFVVGNSGYNYLFVVGGTDGDRKHKEIYFTLLDSNSGYPVLLWPRYASLPATIVDFSAVVLPSTTPAAKLYIIGGTKSDERIDTVSYLSVFPPNTYYTTNLSQYCIGDTALCKNIINDTLPTQDHHQFLPIIPKIH